MKIAAVIVSEIAVTLLLWAGLLVFSLLYPLFYLWFRLVSKNTFSDFIASRCEDFIAVDKFFDTLIAAAKDKEDNGGI